MEKSIIINHRFCGPPQSGNGGYVSGIMANFIEGAATVTLRKPPPLDKEIRVVKSEGKAELYDGEILIAESVPAVFDLDIPAVPEMEEAEEAVNRYDGFREHPFETCFVCGPKREEGDGLRIFTGLVDGREIVAAPWIPHESLGDEDGLVKSEFIWAALDCPGAYAIIDKPPTVVLGRITGEITEGIKVGEKCRVIGWPIGRDGRKCYSGTAVFNEAGELCGAAKSIWFSI